MRRGCLGTLFFALASLSFVQSARAEAIVFSSNRDGNYELYTMNPDGTNQTRLTNNSANDIQPSWSPDGTKIVFVSERDGNHEIYTMNSNGSNPVRLTNAAALDIQPAWSPDGTKIAFRTNRDGNDEIYVMNADGTNPINLTNNFTPYGTGYYNNDFDGDPQWSPDGTRITFSSWRSRVASDIWIMNANGTDPRQLTFGLWASNARWSPGGTRIAYSHAGVISAMNPDGSNQTTVLNVGCCTSPYVGAWSPDGTKLLIYSELFDSNFELYTINSGNGTNRTNLSLNPAVDNDPAWSSGVQPPPAPTGLSAVVGNRQVLLSWDPPASPVDGYNVYAWRTGGQTTVPLGKVNPGGGLVLENSVLLSDVPAECQEISFRVSAVQLNSLASAGSTPAIAESVLSAPISAIPIDSDICDYLRLPKPAHPILFLHGIYSKPSAWIETTDFLQGMFSKELFQFGGELGIDPKRATTDPLAVMPVQNFVQMGDFFTVKFGDPLANYTETPCGERCGILRQADEVGKIIEWLYPTNAGIPSNRLSIVAHSMGGLAARNYIEEHPTEAASHITELITYGTPHQGVDLPYLKEIYRKVAGASDCGQLFPGATKDRCDLVKAFFGPLVESRGASDMNGACDGSRSEFMRDLNPASLPQAIKYRPIVGHFHPQPSLLSLNYYYYLLFPDRESVTGGCFATSDNIIHSDGIVPTVSADLQKLTSLASKPIYRNKFHKDEEIADVPAILCALNYEKCIFWYVYSPVDIRVVGPDGRLMSRDLSAIPGASYMEMEDETGHPVATVLVPYPLTGDYRIEVSPKPDAKPTDTYTITMTRNGITTPVAENQMVQDISEEGYTVPIDVTPPTIIASLSSPANAAVWHNADLIVSFACSDTGSGIATCPNSVAVTTEGAGQVVTGTAVDVDGNSASTSVTVNLDKTAPVLTMPSPITTAATNVSGALVDYSVSAGDNLDPNPIASCTPASGSTFPIGTTTVTCTATDVAGNSSTGTTTVTVQVGQPKLTATVATKGIQSPGVLYVDLRFTNTGTGHARNLRLNSLALRTLSGSGTVTYNTALSSALPAMIGNLDVGSSTTVRLYFNVPSTVTRFSITESGTVQDVIGTSLSYSMGQALVP